MKITPHTCTHCVCVPNRQAFMRAPAPTCTQARVHECSHAGKNEDYGHKRGVRHRPAAGLP